MPSVRKILLQTVKTVQISGTWEGSRVGSKIIRALEIMLAIFLWFDWQFLSSHACLNRIKPKDHDLNKYFSQNCIWYEFFDMNYLKS